MVITNHQLFQFLLCSYSTGWVLVSLRARKRGMVDLCQFVRAFVFAPFMFAGWALISGIAIGILSILMHNIMAILSAAAFVIGGSVILGAIGYFLVSPAVKKAHGVAKPFSEKICIVLYDRRTKGSSTKEEV